jgi:beta-galactosidase
VEVYTKAPEVSLYLNDRLVEKKSVSRSTQWKAVFTVSYEAGTLRAVTSEGDATVLITAGAPAQFRLTSDRTQLRADGQDLAFITLEVLDKDGHIVPEAVVPCTVSVTGQGTLMAAASADLKDREPSTSAKVTTWKGRAIIVVRTTKKGGTLQVNVNADSLKSSIKLMSR